ncbi:CAP domain-containing protein [Glycomyces niveus]|uniref:CAP domain-containing protein n=1 Tax=Glycomyces niveus TaxID=2820287 RepID=A0ABS3U139_9ACTN|nr:CAP domain-containing protein [Glycomyces sp. NEAU-S30]MBO3732484.1 CAP domain-containing protein [Glycomyces sp. NEAU-S30]
MRRLQGGRHRDRAELRRRMLMVIPAVFGLTAGATSLWALGSPLDGIAASDADPTTAAVETTGAEEPASPGAQVEDAPGEAGMRTQEAEEVPTTETPEETSAAPTESDEGDSGGGENEGPTGEYADVEAAVADLVDQERAEAGCGALERDDRLDAAARLHAEDMAAHDYFDHTSQNGRGPTERAAAQGYEGGVGENIAAGYPDAASVMEGWMNSEGHRANILNCDYDVLGVGVADRDGTLYWVQNFG